ncbi:hypothetical protein DID88_003555 [Monilinia fructigena]|uniref:Uncharacterized protein n=1 Tax=Monilinia fructigena TaxID=38457 RepID=A0A395IE34_9HELO|nr:hypothetical protein DID88_003555 [Monilinia fructigena]
MSLKNDAFPLRRLRRHLHIPLQLPHRPCLGHQTRQRRLCLHAQEQSRRNGHMAHRPQERRQSRDGARRKPHGYATFE